MPIKFTRQPDGTYQESGDFAVGTRTVRVYYNEEPSIFNAERDAKEWLKLLRELVKQPCLSYATYELREATVDPPEVIAHRAANLEKSRAAKKKEESDFDERNKDA